MNILSPISVLLNFLLKYFTFDQTSIDKLNGWGNIDYIVVGAGTAGSIVAARLVEAGQKVLVIEAGGEPSDEMTMSRFYNQYLKTDVDWQYETEPQKNALFARPNRTVTISAGKVMGGTGSINAMVYLRGSKYDYDKWEAMGAIGWGYESMLPYIKKIEDSHLTGSFKPEDHNIGGRIKITNEGNDKPILNSFKRVVIEKGYNESDPNDGKVNGVSPVPFNYYDNERQSSYRKYLLPLKKNTDKLLVISGFLVQKIKFDDKKNANVVEVLYEKTGEVIEVAAEKEVILCAGPINTPQILMLSGIGPRKELNKHNISVVSSIPVGKNLHDHFRVALPVFIKKGAQEAGAVVAFVKSDETRNRSDIEMIHYLRNELVLASAILVDAKSRGEVTLKSTSIKDKPIVDPKYLSNENDRKKLGKGLKLMVEFLEKMDTSDTGYTKIPVQKVEQCTSEAAEGSNEYWECVVKYLGITVFHPVGTARMGSANTKGAVVDPSLKVIGVNGLRVVDASVIPRIVSANTQVAVMAIAEKASDLIIADSVNIPIRIA